MNIRYRVLQIGDAELTYEEQQNTKDYKKKTMTEQDDNLGNWMSAALDDEKVCDEMKNDIKKWFDQFKVTDTLEELNDKVPFPAMDKIKWVIVKAPEWYGNADRNIQFMGKKLRLFTKEVDLTENQLHLCRILYENSKDFKVTWELKDKHADIKAEYAAAKEEEKNGGLIVKVFSFKQHKLAYPTWEEDKNPDWKAPEYKLRYYRINWNKFLAWHYARGIYGEVIVSTVKQHIDKGFGTKKRLIGYCENSEAPFKFNHSGPFPYCRPVPNVEIQDEWLEEIKEE